MEITMQNPVPEASSQIPLVSERECSRQLGVSIWLLRRDRRGPKTLPFVRVGTRTIRYDLHAVRHALVTEGGAK